MNTVDIGVGLSFSLQTLEDGRVVPAVNSVDLLVDIDRWDIRIHMFGNLWTDLASLFEVFFKSVVVDLIQTSVTVALQTGIPYETNKLMVASDGFLKIPVIPDWVLDWETPAAAIVTTE